MGLEHRGVKITVGADGRFRAEVGEDETVDATTFEGVKRLITRVLDGTRKFDVPAWFVVLYGVPTRTLDDAKTEVVQSGGRYRGFNLGTKEPKVRLEGSTEDLQVGYYDGLPDMVLAFPSSGQPPLAATTRLTQTVDNYNAAREALLALLDELKAFDVGTAPRDKAAAMRHERAVAERLGGGSP